MNIRDLIDEKKRKFRDLQAANKQKVLIRETARVREDNARRSEVVARQTELNQAQQVNQDLRAAQEPSKMQRFGKGLAAVMNKTKTDVAGAKKQGYMKGIDFGGQARPASPRKAGGRLAQINQGSTGLQLGGSGGGSPFGQGTRNLEFGRPEPVVQQAPRPKSKTVFRY